MQASAPGKLLLAGEYAVLDGGDAVVAAVNRRAVACLVAPPPAPTPILEAVRQALSERFGKESASARTAAQVAVDSSALTGSGGAKLGLGSSAAACAAAVACALANASLERRPDPTEVLLVARQAHGDAQAARGARGSGVDVAAAVLGGVLAARTNGSARPLTLPDDLTLIAIWTGAPADTVSLVAAIRAFAAARPRSYREAAQKLADAASALISACEHNAAAAAVEALTAGRHALVELGSRAGVALELDVHRRLAALAAKRGGTAKPTGAGGGDVALAAFPSAAGARGFREDLMSIGMEELDLRVDPGGIAIS
jgi:phosphomevalonate kinase